MAEYEFWPCDDGDYIFLVSWTDDETIIHQSWLIPGTWIEED